MQQLPASFDTSALDFQNVEKAIASITRNVNIFLLSYQDDDPSSMDGLECLMILASIHLNDALIRKAWTNFRRAIDLARLKGMFKSFSMGERSSNSSTAALRRRLWLTLISGDCYCSLLLGQEASVGIIPFGPDPELWKDTSAEEEANVQRLITLAIVKIGKRNTVIQQGDLEPSEEDDMQISQDLKMIQDSMPPAWWKSPSFRDPALLNSGKDANRLICHFWLFQARIFAKLPLAFKPDPYARREESLNVCMEACRITIHRYLGLQHAKDYLSRCRTVDQAVFVAAIILLLSNVQSMSIYGSTRVSNIDSDLALLEQVILSFQAVGNGSPREHVVRQCYEILSKLMEHTAEDVDMNTTSQNSEEHRIYEEGGVDQVLKPELEIILKTIRSLVSGNTSISDLIEKCIN